MWQWKDWYSSNHERSGHEQKQQQERKLREAGRGQCGHPAEAAGWVLSPSHADSSRDGGKTRGRTASCQTKWAVERVVRCLERETWVQCLPLRLCGLWKSPYLHAGRHKPALLDKETLRLPGQSQPLGLTPLPSPEE